MPAQVLVVEDEPVTRNAYANALIADGHHVRTAAGASACIAALGAARADVVVLDLGLPDSGADQLALARDLCARADLEVIIVSARESIDTKIASLELGATDYLVKPVALAELAARVRRMHRRQQERRGNTFKLGQWTIHIERRVVTGEDGAAVALTRGEFDLLAKLAEARGKIVSRERLSEIVSRGDGDLRSVDALVSRLRKKLRDNPQSPALIVTSPGFGYRLGLPL